MKFIETTFNNHLAEINQTLDVRFAWAVPHGKDAVTNSIPFVKCRDFLGDCLFATQENKKQEIYGFYFDPKKQSYVKTNTQLILRFPNEESYSNFKENLPKLHKVEGKFKYLKTRIVELGNNYLLVIGSRMWLKTITAISLYTFMLKGISYKLDDNKDLFAAIKETTTMVLDWDGKIVERNTLESTYLENLDKFYCFLDNFKKLFKGYKTVQLAKFKIINDVHNRCGFYSIYNYHHGDIGLKFKELYEKQKV